MMKIKRGNVEKVQVGTLLMLGPLTFSVFA